MICQIEWCKESVHIGPLSFSDSEYEWLGCKSHMEEWQKWRITNKGKVNLDWITFRKDLISPFLKDSPWIYDASILPE